jgi:hypothetical protein
MRLCALNVTRSAPVTGGNDDPVVRMSGAAPGTAGAVAAGGVRNSSEPVGAAWNDETSAGMKLMVSDPVPVTGTFDVSMTVDVSPVRLSVIRPAPLSGFVV